MYPHCKTFAHICSLCQNTSQRLAASFWQQNGPITATHKRWRGNVVYIEKNLGPCCVSRRKHCNHSAPSAHRGPTTAFGMFLHRLGSGLALHNRHVLNDAADTLFDIHHGIQERIQKAANPVGENLFMQCTSMHQILLQFIFSIIVVPALMTTLSFLEGFGTNPDQRYKRTLAQIVY